jgi:diadenosine tetraphosphate (Ap4A) HIT family hydrolase
MKTDIEKALNDGSAPWKEIEYRTERFWIFADNSAPPDGYLCFVPTYTTVDCLFDAYRAAYKWGYNGMDTGKWDGFNILQSVGNVAGQGGLYPHIHMIPRRSGDLDECMNFF